MDRSHLLTEQRLSASMNLDALSATQIVQLMNAEDARAVAAVATQQAAIAQAIDLVVAAFKSNGRLFYIGAGTSGRLGVLDAAECPPTFSTPPEMVQGIIAGGDAAMFRAQEGVEDDAAAGASAIDAHNITANDIVMGIAAGGTTPFVHGALARARAIGAKTIFLTCAQSFPGEPTPDVLIRVLTGPEVLTGSTRLKAGTATKLVLNTITTAAMVLLGKTYENLMVDLTATNNKLHDRSVRIIATLTGVDRPAAAELLAQANGQVKVAIVMYTRHVDAETAKTLLATANGRLHTAPAQ